MKILLLLLVVVVAAVLTEIFIICQVLWTISFNRHNEFMKRFKSSLHFTEEETET